MNVQWDICQIIEKRANMHPDKTAIYFEDESISYQRLLDGINQCGHMLLKKGIQKGDRVSVLMLNCIEFLELYFACAKIGAVFVPLNWRLVGPELEYQLIDCGARMLVFHDSFLLNLEAIRSHLKVEADKFVFIASGSPTIPGFELPKCPEWASDYNDLVRNQSNMTLNPPVPVEIDDPLAIVYTSGVTGNPKGAVLSHCQTYFKNFQVGIYTNATPDDVLVAQMPLFHSGGLFIVATPALNSGMTIIMRRGFDANEFAQDIERYKATIVFALTTMWRMILETGKLDEIDVSSVRCVVGGGERTPASLFEELSKRGLYMQQGFGQTENSAMMLMPKADIKRKQGSIGKPGFFTEIWIEGPDGKPLRPGEVGEIVAKGPTVMSQYWNLHDATAKALVNGKLYTGDLGYMDEEGFFYIVDRQKDMYRSGGENVYPAEIEKVLSNHPSISNAAIIGVPDDQWGETGMAFIVPATNCTIDENDVLAYLKGKVAKYKHPKHIRFTDNLPMTATMKVKKSALKKDYSQGRIYKYGEN
jgi:fatty-acyl-CoA synthase